MSPGGTKSVRPDRRHAGFAAFVIHRLSGIMLALFLPMHFLALGLALLSLVYLGARLLELELTTLAFQSLAAISVVVLAVIDNLVKGAAGQAVQNMNIMFGCQENAGLTGIALLP